VAAPVSTPFLTRTTFESMFRPLSSAEGVLADKLLLAATQWIVDQRELAGKPIVVVPPDPMGFLVCFEVVRACFPTIPELEGRTQYTIVTDDRTESGTLPSAGGMLDFDERQRQLLGLAATTGPVYGGMDGDFGGHGYWSPPGGSNFAAVVVGDLPEGS